MKTLRVRLMFGILTGITLVLGGIGIAIPIIQGGVMWATAFTAFPSIVTSRRFGAAGLS